MSERRHLCILTRSSSVTGLTLGTDYIVAWNNAVTDPLGAWSDSDATFDTTLIRRNAIVVPAGVTKMRARFGFVGALAGSPAGGGLSEADILFNNDDTDGHGIMPWAFETGGTSTVVEGHASMGTVDVVEGDYVIARVNVTDGSATSFSVNTNPATYFIAEMW